MDVQERPRPAAPEKVSPVIGAKIRKERLARGWRQEDLAQLMDTTPQSITRYENGQRKISTDLLVEFARVFDIPPARLIPHGDGLSEEERMVIDWARTNPRDWHVLRSTWQGLQSRAGPDWRRSRSV